MQHLISIQIEGNGKTKWMFTSAEIDINKIDRFTHLLSLFGFTWHYEEEL